MDVVAACEGIDAILYSLLGAVAWHVADKLNIPCFRVFFFPADPTSKFPAITAPSLPLGSVYNRFTFACGDFLWTRATRKLLNDWRESLGLSPIRPFSFPYRSLHKKPVPTLYAYSSLVAPKPAEWDNNKYLTGYWVGDSKTDWKPDQTLVDFLKAGSRPIYIGFGSMVDGSFGQVLNMVLESPRATKQRAIFSAGWGSLQEQHCQNMSTKLGLFPMNGFSNM